MTDVISPDRVAALTAAMGMFIGGDPRVREHVERGLILAIIANAYDQRAGWAARSLSPDGRLRP